MVTQQFITSVYRVKWTLNIESIQYDLDWVQFWPLPDPRWLCFVGLEICSVFTLLVWSCWQTNRPTNQLINQLSKQLINQLSSSQQTS